MKPTLRSAAVAAFVFAALTACGDEKPRADPQPAPAAPCLVTAEELEEISGTPQEIREVDIAGGGLGTTLSCDTVLDEREVSMNWSLREPFIDPPPTYDEQRTFVDDPGMKTQEADLGDGQAGWVSAGRPIGLAEAQVVTLLDDLMLNVTVTATEDDSPLTVAQIEDEALALARAVVAARKE